MNKIFLMILCGIFIISCSEVDSLPSEVTKDTTEAADILVHGRWIYEADSKVMSDPQTSGLTVWQGLLVSLSDGSAQLDQQRKLHFIDVDTATVINKTPEMVLSKRVARSCFAQYLNNSPDLEALVVDPHDDSIFYTVTEDATKTGALSDRCQKKYENTGSTGYPTLLVKLQLTDKGKIIVDAVRPLQFDLKYQVGDFPNDGIEGLAITPDNILYLGLEKDAHSQPRIFSVNIGGEFWQSKEFARVEAPDLNTPSFDKGNHPINGMTYYYDDIQQRGFLLAAARNDNQLWIIDEKGEWPTKIIPLQFTAPNHDHDGNCASTEIMDNASIEGLAILEDKLWLINDPWKVNYMKNVQCEGNRERYSLFAPLIFSLPIDGHWFRAD